MGIDMKIKLVKLQKAVLKLKDYNIKERLSEFNPSSLQDLQDLWVSQKTEFLRFMNVCINWCISNKKKMIKFGFY